MGVRFTTQQGRTLMADLSVDVFTAALMHSPNVVCGYEVGAQRRKIYVNTQHIVEWWEATPDEARQTSEAVNA